MVHRSDSVVLDDDVKEKHMEFMAIVWTIWSIMMVFVIIANYKGW